MDIYKTKNLKEARELRERQGNVLTAKHRQEALRIADEHFSGYVKLVGVCGGWKVFMTMRDWVIWRGQR